MDNTLFSTSMMLVDKLVGHVNSENLHKPTPCSEWDVEKLTNHMLNELAWVAPLVEGKTIAEIGDLYDGDLIKGNAAESWMKYCKEASSAIATADPAGTAHLSYADKPNQEYVDEVASDLIIHGWDLAQALGQPFNIDDKTADLVEKSVKDLLPMARQGGYIGETVAIDGNSNKMEKLLASYGRKINWK